MAELSGPFPPGDYPVVVVGSGPGALQVSYSLRRLGVDHAVISSDPSPGGMFRRWPFFQRLLSWTKPHAPAVRGSPSYERYDWNSLLGDEPDTCALQPTLMDGSSYFPSRPEMEASLALFAERAGIDIRYGTRWTGTRQVSTPDGDRFEVETTDGRYSARVLVVAVGVAEPYTPPGIGMEHTHHYADVRPVQEYADRRVLIIGKQNSGFELATGLLPWARQLIVSSPSKVRLSVDTKSLVGVRARYVQPYEDHVLGGGVSVLDAATDRIERTADGKLTVHLRRTDGGADLAIEVDDAISATGFVSPLVDLPELGVTTFGASKLPVQTPWWESATVPGIFFAGTIGQGSKGLQKHGIPANSGGVHGARYNARVLATYIARDILRVRAGATDRGARRRDRVRRDRAGRVARPLPPARLPGPRPGRGRVGRAPRRGHPAARPRAGRRRLGRARDDARGRRLRRHLPGAVHPDRRADRRADARARSADALRHDRCAADDRRDGGADHSR